MTGLELKLKRITLGLTQERLAELASCCSKSVSRAERRRADSIPEYLLRAIERTS